jgi:hypothetical protein
MRRSDDGGLRCAMRGELLEAERTVRVAGGRMRPPEVLPLWQTNESVLEASPEDALATGNWLCALFGGFHVDRRLGDLRQLLVGIAFFVKRLLEKLGGFVVPEQLGV